MATTKNSRTPVIVIGVISLLGLLSYTWIHTGNLLASYVSPSVVGFLAAGGIELSIVGLSMRIGELKRSGLSYRFFLFTLVAVVVVSALANIAEGFQVKFGETLTIVNWNKLDIVQIVVSIAATGLISLVTLALSEIVGQDVATAQKNSNKRISETVVLPSISTQEAPVVPELDKPERSLLKAPNKISVESYESFVAAMSAMNPAPKNGSEVELVFGIKHATAYRWFNKYQEKVQMETMGDTGEG